MNEPGPGAFAPRFSEGQVETEADALVSELAESDPYHDVQDHFSDCFYCGAKNGTIGIPSPTPVDHKPTCLWLRARKLAGLT